MKLRIQGNSIRLRVSRSELARFIENGELAETLRFGPDPGAELAYSLVRDPALSEIGVDSAPGRVAVLVPAPTALLWAQTDQVGIRGEADLGPRGTLSILVEKDFACIDRNAEDNADTFPNPRPAHAC